MHLIKMTPFQGIKKKTSVGVKKIIFLPGGKFS